MRSRLERILQILMLLQTRVPYDAFQLAQEMSVHRRTIFRDIAALRELGIPIDFDIDSACYTLSARSALSLDRVSVEELSELLVTACLATDQHRDRAEVIKRAALKLSAQLPEPMREEIARLVLRPERNGHSSDFHALSTIKQAIATGRSLELSELVPSGECHSRHVVPASLTYCRRGWILQGIDDNGVEQRFLVDGFPLAKPINEDDPS